MLKLNEKFVDAAKGILIQPLPYDRILETRPQAKKALEHVVNDLTKMFDDTYSIFGDNKLEKTAENKAKRDYDGELRCVTDHIRAKLVVSSAHTIRTLQSLEFKKLLQEYGIEIAGHNDLFDDPKDDTGYRCVNLKLAVPINEDGTKKHIVELQVVAQQIEDKYDETHVYKRIAEDAMNKIQRLENETKFEDLSINDLKDMSENGEYLSVAQEDAIDAFEEEMKPLKHIAKINYAKCRLTNNRAAKGDNPDNDYEALLSDDPVIRDKHTMTPNKEAILEMQAKEAEERLATSLG